MLSSKGKAMTAYIAHVYEDRLPEKSRIVLRKSAYMAFTIILTYLILSPFIGLSWNITKSLPGHLYVYVKFMEPGLSDVAAFVPPKNPYYTRTNFIKIVRGIPGDVVTIEGRDFYINGLRVGTAKPQSMGGDDLPLGESGVIPEGKYFLWTSHPDSFDSRYGYIGFVDEEAFLGRAFRIL